MSEYQYYEFLAIDRPLSSSEIQELRTLSTRAEEERKRKAYLAEMAKQFPATWDKVEKFTEEKTGTAYEQAVKLLVDLSDAYVQAENTEEFRIRFSNFITKYKNRSVLIRRINEAGLKLPMI